MRSVAAFAVLSICACASTTSSSPEASRGTKQANMQTCDPYVPAVAATDTDVFARPDSTSDVVGVLTTRSNVCADPSSAGFGFRRVRLANGKSGYVPETVLSDS